ncbi:MAG: hypothetical protein AAF581_04670 [Planctomycetota bacterium]
MKALERQLGAQKIELDTRDAWAHFDIHQNIDLEKVADAAYDASYTLSILDFSVKGRVEKKDDFSEHVIAPHGQRLAWTGKGPERDMDIRIRLKGDVNTKFPVYELVPADAVMPAGPPVSN